MSNSSLKLAGFILCLVGGIVALAFGALNVISGLPTLSLGLIYGIVDMALGLLVLILSLRVNRRYDTTLVIVILVFGIIMFVVSDWISGLLVLIGAILWLIAKG